MNRRRQRTVRRRARKEIRDREESKRVERAKKEVVVAKWNVRTLAVKGKNGLGHAETLLQTAITKVTLRHHRIAKGETGWTRVV